jgi:hypothetical protein
VSPAGHIFTPEQLHAILHDEQLTLFQRTIFERAMMPGTGSHAYAVKLRQPIDVFELERKLRSGELTD